MKIAVPNRGLLTNRRAAWCIVSLISLLMAGYLIGRYLGLLIVLLLGVAGIVIGRAVSARLDSNNNFDQPETASDWRDTPQITVGWDYRPRGAIRRCAAVDLAWETAEDPSSSRPAINENVWFNALDSSAVDHEPTVEDTTEKALLPGRANLVSTYDQSPIDNHGVGAE